MEPCDLFLFPLLKLHLRRHPLESINSLKKSLQTLKGFHKIDFKACFGYRKKVGRKYVTVGGDYFEGDTVNCYQ